MVQNQDQSGQSDLESMSFESALASLEGIVRALEAGDLSLDVAIDQFQQGMQFVRVCREKLHAAEQKVELVLATEAGVTTRPFDIEE